MYFWEWMKSVHNLRTNAARHVAYLRRNAARHVAHAITAVRKTAANVQIAKTCQNLAVQTRRRGNANYDNVPTWDRGS